MKLFFQNKILYFIEYKGSQTLVLVYVSQVLFRLAFIEGVIQENNSYHNDHSLS